MIKNIKSKVICMIFTLLLIVSMGFGLSFNKTQNVNAQDFVVGNASAKIFNSQTSFDLAKNGKNGFIAMYGQTCQNLPSWAGESNKVGFENSLSDTKFTNIMSATFNNEYFKGSQPYTLVGETAMVVNDVDQASTDGTKFRPIEVPVRAFKFPSNGTVSVRVEAWMDEVERASSLAAVVSHNTTYLADNSNLLQDFNADGVSNANDKWVYTTTLNVLTNDMLYVEVHNGTSSSIAGLKAHTTINVEYTALTDSLVTEVKNEIDSLKSSDYSTTDASKIIALYDKVGMMSDLQRAFITTSQGQKLSNAYVSIKELMGSKVVASNENYSSIVQGEGGFYYMYGGTEPSSFTECKNNVIIENINYWQGSSPFNIQSQDKLICNGVGATDYPVRAYKVAMSGKIQLVVSACMEYARTIGDPFTLHVYKNSTQLNEFEETLTIEPFSNVVQLDVNQGEYIYVTVRNTGVVDNVSVKFNMSVVYLESLDTNVQQLNGVIASANDLESVTKDDYNLVKSSLETYFSFTDLQKAFTNNVDKLYAIYDKSFALDTQYKIDSLPEKITLEHVAKVNELTAILNGMTTNQKSYISSNSLTKHQQAVTQVEVINSLSEFYGLVDSLPLKILPEDRYQVNNVTICYNNLTQTQKDAIDISYLSKYNLAVKTISDYDKASQLVVDIENLPSINNLTVSYIQPIKDLYATYNSLEAIAKEKVTNVNILEDAIVVIEELELAQNQAKAIVLEIDNLGDINNITLQQETAVKNILASYQNLSQTAKDLVSNYNKLLLAITKIDKLHAKVVSDLISNLPTTITLSNELDVINAREAYNNLTEEQKEFVTNLNVLVLAEQEIQNLKDQNVSSSSSSSNVVVSQSSNSSSIEQSSAISKSEETSSSSISIQEPSSSSSNSSVVSQSSNSSSIEQSSAISKSEETSSSSISIQEPSSSSSNSSVVSQSSAISKSEETSSSSAKTQKPSSSNTPSATPSKRGGCGGSLSASFVLLPLVLIAFIILKKKIN